MTIAELASAWDAPPGVLAIATFATLCFAQAFLRLRHRRRPDLAPWTRPFLFAAGLALAVLPLISPLDAAGDDYLLSAHMLQHMLIGDAAPLLLVLAVRGPLTFFLVPPRILKPLASFPPLRYLLGLLTRPSVTFALWASAMVGWHIPAAYDAALAHPLVHVAEHTCFIIFGTLVWTQLINAPRHARRSRARRTSFAFGLLLIGHPVADVLLFASSPVYPRYAAQTDRLFGISVISDQRLAGAIMLVEQLLTVGSYLAAHLWPLRPQLAAEPRRG